MAQLKDTVVSGSLRATDSLLATNLILSGSQTARYVLAAPTSNGAPSFRALTNADVGLGNVENKALSTWTGTSTIATVGTITSGTWSASTIAVNKGGTGQTSWTQWGVLYASASTTLTNTAAGTAGYLLQGNGAAAPSWIQATNSNTASTIVKRDASGNFSAGTITASLTGNVTGNCSGSSGSCTGNAATVSRATFGDASNGEHNCNNITSNGLWYYNSNGPSGLGNWSTDGALYSQAHNTNWVGQIAQDYRTGGLFVRSKKNNTWQSWKAIPMGVPYAMTDCRIEYDASTQKFTKFAGGNDWNAEARSTVGYKECRVTFRAGTTGKAIMFGLNSDPTANASYGSVDYCWYLQNGSTPSINIYENGTSISSITGHTTYGIGDEFIIEYSNGYVRYYHNGVLCRQVARSYGTLLYVDSSFHGQDGIIYDVQFEPIHDKNYLRMYYRNTDISSTNEMRNENYLLTVGDTGGWPTTATKPSGADNALGILHMHLHDGNYYYQVAFNGTKDNLHFRSAYNTTTWGAWRTVLHDNNYTSYTVKKDGTGASGSWGISVTGSSGSCTGNAATVTTTADTTNELYILGVTSGATTTIKRDTSITIKGGTLTATEVKGAVWNDYAEYRKCDELAPGMCVQENDDGKLTASNRRLIPACSIITDTFGFSEGETDDAKTPVAVAGRVLAYTYLPRRMYHAGMAVCSAPGGTIDIMTREEIRDYPDCIIGYVSEIPDYEEWGTGNVKVNGRIWIKVK